MKSSDGEQAFWLAFEKESKFRRAPEIDVSPSTRRRFAEMWVKRFEDTRLIAERLRRRPELSDNELRQLAQTLGNPAVTAIIQPKVVGRGRWEHVVVQAILREVHYHSVQGFCSCHQILVKGSHYKTALLRLRQVVPGPRLVYKNLRPLTPLTKEHKQLRVKFCLRLLKRLGEYAGGPESHIELSLHYLYMVRWIDAKRFWLCPKTHKAWWFAGLDNTGIGPRMNDKIRIVYYIVVNAILGPVYSELVTRTSEHEQDPYSRIYMVSQLPTTTHRSLCMSACPGCAALSAWCCTTHPHLQSAA